MKPILKLLLISLLSACTYKAQVLTLTVTYTKNGYTYASSSYRTYRAKLDTMLSPGTRVTAEPTSDSSCKNVFIRVK
jgi:hypothetical protein